MNKRHLSDAVLVVGIAIFIVVLPTIYGWYLSSPDLLKRPRIRSQT